MYLHHADLKDTASINTAIKSIKPDFVFHLAAQSFPKTSFSAPVETMDTNAQGTLRLLNSLKEYSPLKQKSMFVLRLRSLAVSERNNCLLVKM